MCRPAMVHSVLCVQSVESQILLVDAYNDIALTITKTFIIKFCSGEF